jgi:glycosyltransferase 2 family protein
MDSSKKSRRGYIISIGVLLVLLTICVIVFRDKLPDIITAVKDIPTERVIILLCMGMIYQLIDTAMCLVLVRSRLPELSYLQAFELTMTGVFGMVCSNSIITIPTQSFYLYTLGLDVGHTVGLMTVKYVFHKLMIFFAALLALLCSFDWLNAAVPGAMKYLLPGFALCGVIILFLVLLCTWDKLRRLLYAILDKLPSDGKWGEKKEGWRRNVDLMYTEMQNLLGQKKRVAAICAINALKFIVVYSIPFMALRALGCDAPDYMHALALTALVWLIAGVLPNVSGLGPLDAAFALLFGSFAAESMVSASLVLYRASTYFVPFIVSIPTVYIMQKRARSAFAAEKSKQQDTERETV